MRLIIFLILGQIIFNGLLLRAVCKGTNKDSLWRKITQVWVYFEVFAFLIVFLRRATYGGAFARGGFTIFFNYYVYLILLFMLLYTAYAIIWILKKFNIAKTKESIKNLRGIALLILVPITLIICVQGHYNTMLPKVVHYNITLPYEGPTKKIKAAFISDIHIGDIIDYKQVKLLVELVQKEQPDYVFVGGDQLDYYFSYVANDLDNYTSLMRSLHNDQSKIFYVLGNHEYYKDLKEKTEWFHNIGTLICDSVVQLDHNLFLIGRDDAFNSNRAELSTLVRDIPSTATTILLSHQPRDPKEELDNGINLALHGHTHEGQFIPFSWLMYLVYDNPHGYKRVGETHYITSSGFGVSTTSLRVGTHSEIAIIDITLESKENN